MNLNTGGWPSPLLRLVARLRSDGLNSTTPVTEINGGTISATNADIAIVARGNGATLAQVPDGTTAGGNKRGINATDLQKLRVASSQVASGSYAAIGGGESNTASSTWTVVAGGSNNLASGQVSIIGGGLNNTASGQYAAVLGGTNNTASAQLSFVGGGQSNTAQSNTHATVCGGATNTASGQYSFVGGGLSNTASASYSSVLGGSNNTANQERSCVVGGANGTTRSIRGLIVFPACASPIADAQGVTQSALLLLGRQTTDATPTVLTSNTTAGNTANQVILPNNSAYYFRGSVIANVTAGGDTKAWTFEGAIKRGATAATTAIVDTVVLNVIAQDAGAAAWSVAITADTTNGGIAVTVTGAASTTIRWVAKLETTEVTY